MYLSKDEKSVNIQSDVNKTAESIAKYSERDADAYKEYQKFLQKISKFINNWMDNPPPNIDVENLTMASLVV